ncbi:UTP--glucose-1-phosphate uridylyltransferase [Candidatus Mycoplasma pogonae]
MENQTKVKKLVIPAAGWGTRFLPITKVVHKELIPILNRPIIELLVEEALAAGIEEIILVISPRKLEINSYFLINEELEKELSEKAKQELLTTLKKTNISEHITVAYQTQQLGLGHAIAKAAKYINNEPFAVILGDDLIDADVPAIQQLIEQFNKLNSSIVGVQTVEYRNLSKYGIVKPKYDAEKNKQLFEIVDAVEKPQPDQAPSQKAILGRYVFTPEILKILSKQKPTLGGEVQLVDAFDELMQTQKIYAFEFEGKRYDLGAVEDFVKANVDYALKDPNLKTQIEDFIIQKAAVIKK